MFALLKPVYEPATSTVPVIDTADPAALSPRMVMVTPVCPVVADRVMVSEVLKSNMLFWLGP